MTCLRGLIAVDFGGVCSVHQSEAGAEHTSTTINMPHCLETLQKLAERNRLVLVSFCGRRRAIETRDAIERTCPGLFEALYFVRDRTRKGDVCAALGAVALIDDSADVLATVRPPCKPILFRTWPELATLEVPYLPEQGGPDAIRRLIYPL